MDFLFFQDDLPFPARDFSRVKIYGGGMKDIPFKRTGKIEIRISGPSTTTLQRILGRLKINYPINKKTSVQGGVLVIRLQTKEVCDDIERALTITPEAFLKRYKDF